jgi:eukaryotic-like serine/threonine-protein kinase
LSPDGGTIRFSKNRALWEISSNGANLHPFLSAWRPSDAKCCGTWSPDGNFYLFLGPAATGHGSQIYALDERQGLLRRTANQPFQLTSGPISWGWDVFSKDGKKVFATGATYAGELVRLDPKSNQFQAFLGGISADLVAFSKDGQSVAYISFPDDILWRANRDGSDKVQLTSPPLNPLSLEWSPDGSQLTFMAQSPQGQAQAWIVSARGGAPQRLLPEDSQEETDPRWSPDGNKVFLAMRPGRSRDPQSSSIRILDLASHQISTLPGSTGMDSPHWSPDGQFIEANAVDLSAVNIFDVKTQHWSTLHIGIHAYETWSSDSRFIYFLRYVNDPAILRVPLTGGEAKVVVDLKGFRYIGTLGLWFGLDPNDTPLMLRDVSTSDVYALTLEK